MPQARRHSSLPADAQRIVIGPGLLPRIRLQFILASLTRPCAPLGLASAWVGPARASSSSPRWLANAGRVDGLAEKEHPRKTFAAGNDFSPSRHDTQPGELNTHAVKGNPRKKCCACAAGGNFSRSKRDAQSRELNITPLDIPVTYCISF